MLPYWQGRSFWTCAGKVILLAAHRNFLRALVKHLDRISDADVAALNFPTGIPSRYEFDEDLRPGDAWRGIPRP